MQRLRSPRPANPTTVLALLLTPVLITSTADPSKRYTRSYHVGGLAQRATRRRPHRAHSKPSSDRRARTLDVGERMAHAFGRWRSQQHRWWPPAGVSGGGRDLTLRADDLTSLGTTSLKPPNLAANNLTQKSRFLSWALTHTSLIRHLGSPVHINAQPRARNRTVTVSHATRGPREGEEKPYRAR